MHDQEMSDVSDPLLTCDADVVGSGAALNNHSMHVDMDVDVTGENTHSPRRLSSPQSPTSALSGFFSMIEYATKPVLIDIAKRHTCNFLCESTSRRCALLLYPTRHLANVLNRKLMCARNLFLKARHM
jgi:hypothetical protein